MAYCGKYDRVMLVVPSYRKSHYEYAGLPAGLGYISEALETSGIGQEVVDMRLGYPYTHLKKRIRQFKPKLIGFSLMSFRYKEHYALMDRVKKDFPDIKITGKLAKKDMKIISQKRERTLPNFFPQQPNNEDVFLEEKRFKGMLGSKIDNTFIPYSKYSFKKKEMKKFETKQHTTIHF